MVRRTATGGRAACLAGGRPTTTNVKPGERAAGPSLTPSPPIQFLRKRSERYTSRSKGQRLLIPGAPGEEVGVGRQRLLGGGGILGNRHAPRHLLTIAGRAAQEAA